MLEIFKELHKGIDSLYLSFRGILKGGMKEELEQRKLFAQSDDEREQALAKITIGDHTFEVMDKGKGRYAYVLADGWFHIQVSASKRRLPALYVQISSDLLNCYGLYIAMNQLRGVVKDLLDGIEEETLSRADIFVDFMTDTYLGEINKRAWVTRAKAAEYHWSGDTYTGVSIGLGGDISARLYDKTIEIEKSQKDYFKSFWQKAGWFNNSPVWRLEFQLKREVIKQFSLNRVVDFVEVSNDVWRYCTQSWLRLSVENPVSNRTRLQPHPLWTAIGQVKFGAGAYTGIYRDVSKSRMPNRKAIFLNSMGYLTAYAAHKGYDCLTDEVLLEYLREATEFLTDYTKNSPVYESPIDYMQAKINLKKKKYNKE